MTDIPSGKFEHGNVFRSLRIQCFSAILVRTCDWLFSSDMSIPIVPPRCIVVEFTESKSVRFDWLGSFVTKLIDIPQLRSASFNAVSGFTHAGYPSSDLITSCKPSLHLTSFAGTPALNCSSGV